LWPQSDEQHARTTLRSTLARLRKTLGEESAHDAEEAGHFFIEGDLLVLEPRGIYLDLEALEAAVSLSRRETSPPAGGGSSADDADAAVGGQELIGHLQEALGLYRGEFMEGFSVEDAPEFELWVEGERTRRRRLFGELCERLSRLQGETGYMEEAISTARMWAGHAPLEEAAQRRLMELLSSAGESEGALLAYEGYQDTLKRGLNVEPSPQIKELAARLREEVEERASLGASLARSGATTTPLSELEVPLTGRHEEFGALVSEYHGAREGKARVVAVLGEGG
jgi:DNA-binding SARP family transcriptional activator